MPCREQDHSMARWGQVATRHRAVTVALMLRCRPLCLRHVGEWQLRGALSCRTVNFRAQGTSKENLGTDLEWCFGCFHGLGVPDGFARDIHVVRMDLIVRVFNGFLSPRSCLRRLF